jgi:hypothetical protein
MVAAYLRRLGAGLWWAWLVFAQAVALVYLWDRLAGRVGLW